MLIILLRHGIAEPKGGGKPDADRTLTKEGHRKMKRVAKALAKRLPDADAIFSSPLARAFETAEWVAKASDGKLTIDTATALTPGSDPAEFREILRRSTAACAYFVGHEPHLTSLMLALTGMEASGELALKKGGCYGLEIDGPDDAARLEWMIPPNLLH